MPEAPTETAAGPRGLLTLLLLAALAGVGAWYFTREDTPSARARSDEDPPSTDALPERADPDRVPRVMPPPAIVVFGGDAAARGPNSPTGAALPTGAAVPSAPAEPLALAPSGAAAPLGDGAPPDDDASSRAAWEEARAHFQRASEAFGAQAFSEAAAEFERANLARQDPVALVMAADARRRNGEREAALRHLREVLAHTGPDSAAHRRAMVIVGELNAHEAMAAALDASAAPTPDPTAPTAPAAAPADR